MSLPSWLSARWLKLFFLTVKQLIILGDPKLTILVKHFDIIRDEYSSAMVARKSGELAFVLAN